VIDMLNCAVIYPLRNKLQRGLFANSGVRVIAGVQAPPASASEACTPQCPISLNALGASSHAPETVKDVGRNTLKGTSKPVRALSAGQVFPALRLPETPTLADAGWSYSGLLRDMPFTGNLIP